MQSIKFDGKAYELPERWSDVAPDQLPQLLHLVYFAGGTPESIQELLRITLQIRAKEWKGLMQKHFGPKVGKRVRQANAVVLHELKHQLRWMYLEPIHEQPFTHLDLDLGVELLLPDTDFLTMSFGELSDAYIHFLVYLRQIVPGETHLDLLVATLCRPERAGDYETGQDWDGDKREPYNEFMARERAKLVALLPAEYKMAVMLFFAGNMQRVLDRYALSDDEPGDPEEYPGQGWIKNQHLLASKGIFGNLAQTKAANLHDVLIFLEENRKDILAANERNKQQEA